MNPGISLLCGAVLAATICMPESSFGKDAWELKIIPGVPSGVSFVDEKADYRLVVKAASKQAGPVTLEVAVKTPGATERSESWEMSLTGEESVEKVISLPTSARGYWSLRASLADQSGKKLAQKESALAVVARPANYGRMDADSFFGSMFNRDPEAGQRIGIKYERQMAAWSWLAPSPDTYAWELLDRRLDLMQQHGTSVVLVIRPEMAPKWAEWKSLEELASSQFLPAYRKFVRDVVERYGHRVQAIELVNEPDLDCARDASGKMTPAEIYAILLAEGYKAAKSAAPDLPIIGLDVSGVDFPALKFCREVLAKDAGSLDIIGGHPYTSTRYIGGGARAESPDDIDTAQRIGKMGALMESHGLKPRIWPTEFGWALYKDESMASPAAETLAAYVAQALALARSVPTVGKLFWFSWYFPGYEGGGFSYGLFRGTELEELFPTPGAVALATTARFLDKVSFVHKVKLGDLVTGLRFLDTQTSEGIFVLWLGAPKAAGGEVTILMPSGLMNDAEVNDGYGRPQQGPLLVREMPVFIRVPGSAAEGFEKALRTAKIEAKERLFVDAAYLSGPAEATIVAANNSGAPVSVKIFPKDQPTLGLSRRLAPGRASIVLPLGDLPPGRVSLPMILMEEASGRRTEFVLDYDVTPVPALRAVHIDGRLDETTALAGVSAERRESILPADPGVDWKGPDDLSMKVWTASTASGLYLAIRVTDDVMAENPPDASQFWTKDSLQIAWDMSNHSDVGYDDHCLEIGIFQTADGPEIKETFPKMERRSDIPAAIRREDKVTSYELLVPWSALGLKEAPSAAVFRMNIVANDSDGMQRKCWVGLSPGIGEGKRPSAFRQWMINQPESATENKPQSKSAP
ncbi:MAG: hypothetical protein BGO12_06805 [Verrucomicrobia bacterium 61-8]|nr:beta-galactosidase [Verrucomicrobiota bacterium]OJV14149.1 MAG: hypothetical protein BGO12_06805 [Verrucomicrobia bacterium 61-8]